MAPEHGEVSFQNTSFQSVASYECVIEMVLAGDAGDAADASAFAKDFRERLHISDAEHNLVLAISDGAPVDDSTLMANGPDILMRHLKAVVADLSATPTSCASVPFAACTASCTTSSSFG